jgi:hypothetical protein
MEDKKVTLEEFINNHPNLLSTIGILGALTIFADEISIQSLNHLLSFLSLGLTMLCWFELWDKFPKNGSELLSWFENIMSFLVMLFCFYWLLNYWDLWREFLVIPVSAILLWVASKLIKSNKLIDTFKISNLKVKKFVSYVTAIILVVGILILGNMISKKIVTIVDGHNELVNKK